MQHMSGPGGSGRRGGGAGPCYQWRDNGSCQFGDSCQSFVREGASQRFCPCAQCHTRTSMRSAIRCFLRPTQTHSQWGPSYEDMRHSLQCLWRPCPAPEWTSQPPPSHYNGPRPSRRTERDFHPLPQPQPHCNATPQQYNATTQPHYATPQQSGQQEPVEPLVPEHLPPAHLTHRGVDVSRERKKKNGSNNNKKKTTYSIDELLAMQPESMREEAEAVEVKATPTPVAVHTEVGEDDDATALQLAMDTLSFLPMRGGAGVGASGFGSTPLSLPRALVLQLSANVQYAHENTAADPFYPVRAYCQYGLLLGAYDDEHGHRAAKTLPLQDCATRATPDAVAAQLLAMVQRQEEEEVVEEEVMVVGWYCANWGEGVDWSTHLWRVASHHARLSLCVVVDALRTLRSADVCMEVYRVQSQLRHVAPLPFELTTTT